MSIKPGFAPSSEFDKGSEEYFKAKRLEKNWKLFTGSAAPPAGWLCTVLDDTERRIAVSVGKERQRRSTADGRKDGFTENCTDPEKVHILGACGELAFAKLTGRYWSMGIDTFQAGDVGRFEVRTRSDVHYDLKVRKDEPAGRYVVQVFGCCDLRDIGGVDTSEERTVKELFDPVQPVGKASGTPLLSPLPCYRFFVAGYILSDHAKQQQYESDRAGFENAYLVPQCDLRSPETLIVRDWIAHYELERKAPRPNFRSYNEYTGGDYYPAPEPEYAQAELVSVPVMPPIPQESALVKA